MNPLSKRNLERARALLDEFEQAELEGKENHGFYLLMIEDKPLTVEFSSILTRMSIQQVVSGVADILIDEAPPGTDIEELAVHVATLFRAILKDKTCKNDPQPHH